MEAPAHMLDSPKLARRLRLLSAHWRAAWSERWLAFRNARIADPAFQRWAARFPPTRGLARRNSRALFDLCAGFVYSQVLFACVKLDLFQRLADGPRSSAQLSPTLGLNETATRRLLDAAASLRLLRALPDGRFALADLGAALLGNPAVAAMIEHHAMLYADLADPVGLLREGGKGQLAAYWGYADHNRLDAASEESVAGYGRLMAESLALLARDVLAACPLADRTCLMDVGGGEGAFLAEAALRHPNLRLMLFDLPPVARRAQAALAQLGLAARVTCHDGSFHDGNLPRGADAISLVRVLHDHDDAAVRALLKAVHAALPPGGLVIVAEPMAGTPGGEPIGAAYFGLYLLAMGSGRARRSEETSRMLAEAGFVEIHERPTPTPLMARLITAKRPVKCKVDLTQKYVCLG